MIWEWVKKNIHKDGQDAAFYICVIGSSVMLATALLCGIYFTIHMHSAHAMEEVPTEIYNKQYVLITDSAEEEFWKEVYQGAQDEAVQNNIYVENLGENLSMDYNTEDLLRMAINASVDGIILCGDDNKETARLINQAVDKGICVTTIRQDVDNCNRQCFVGLNLYDLGNTFGKQILQVMNLDDQNPGKICILMDDTEPESRQNIITLAIRDTLNQAGNGLVIPDIEIRPIDTSDTFSAEEDIRDIFLDEENMPDVIVCLNSIYTKCCYQAVVDYNRVGDVKIIGYYASDTILEAIEKRIIYSTIRVQAADMGKQCIKAMQEYQETGYANSYIPVGIDLIGQKEAEALLQNVE